MNEIELRKLRWRLVLGEGGADALGNSLDDLWKRREEALGFLYDREGGGRNVRTGPRSGGTEGSSLTVPDWINEIHELFPQATIERIEKDAIERYKIEEIVTNPDVLERVQPSETLLKAVLRTKHLMNQDVLKMARTLVSRVVQQLIEKLAREVRSPFQGSLDRRRRSFVKSAANFDAETTIRRNLKHYDRESKRLFIQTPYFFSRVRRQVDKWDIIILVDQSGSMLDSAIHSAVTAAIFWEIKSLRPHLVLFDTAVVDVTENCSDPVETLMKVQLGGGTDIGQAVAYAGQLVTAPRRTIVVLVTDFFEGGPEYRLINEVRKLVESGVTFLGLAALDSDARPNYDRDLAGRLVAQGAHVGAMTPGELAAWVAEKVAGR
jgi:Mg-chelatase subunit ChlD